MVEMSLVLSKTWIVELKYHEARGIVIYTSPNINQGKGNIFKYKQKDKIY